MFPCCSTREDLSIDETITNVGLILTKLRKIQLFGTSQNSISNFQRDRRTDIHGFGILSWKHVGTQKISTQN